MGEEILENTVARQVVDAAFHVYMELGAGLLESVYEAALHEELRLRGLSVSRQVGVSVAYKGIDCGVGFRADLVVSDAVVVEIKAVEQLSLVHRAQLLTYLRLMDRRLGLLINFHAPRIKDGIIRVANNLRP